MWRSLRKAPQHRRYAQSVREKALPGARYHITEVAIRAAVRAGEVALEGFRSGTLDTQRKRDQHDVVTQYDRACEALIREEILASFPHSTIIGEEAGTVLGDAGPDTLTWYVDPIDGTSNYARGIAMWAVSIGVEWNGDLIVGVIVDPVSQHVFWADDRGAFLRDAEGERRLSAEGTRRASEATVALNFPLARDLVHFPELALTQFAEVTKAFAQVRGLGSTCIALAWIAAGWLDVTISFETNPWDVAAGAFVIRQAGGVFTGYRDGRAVATQDAHLAPHYYAAGADGEFAVLHDIMRTQSQRPSR